MKLSSAFPLLILLSCTALSEATIVFTTNFDDQTAGSTISPLLTEAGGGTRDSLFVDLGSSDIALRQTISGTSTSNASASFAAANAQFVTAGGFEITTTFTLNSFTLAGTGVVNVSLSAFGSDSNLGSGSAYRLIYTVGVNNAGTLALQDTTASPSGTTVVTPSVGSIAPVSGGTQFLTLTLKGIYESPTLIRLTGTVSNGSSTLTTVVTDTSILTGTNFGVRAAQNGDGSSNAETVTYSGITLETIPEPSALVFAFATAGFFGLRRKRA